MGKFHLAALVSGLWYFASCIGLQGTVIISAISTISNARAFIAILRQNVCRVCAGEMDCLDIWCGCSCTLQDEF